MDEKIENESVEQYQHRQQLSSLSISNDEKNSSLKITTTNHSSPTAVNHLPLAKESEEKEEEEEEEEEETAAAVVLVNDSSIKSEKTQQSTDKNTANVNIKQITNSEEEQSNRYQLMSSDDESDNDSELLQTLAQLHDLAHPSRLPTELNGTEIFQNKLRQHPDEESNYFRSNSNVDEKSNIPLSNEDDKNHTRNTDKQSSTLFSLTSLTSSVLFNEDESRSMDIMLDSDASSSFIMSDSDYTNPMLSFHRLTKNTSPLVSSFDTEVISIVERLVSDTLQSAEDQINQSPPVVEQILFEAISDEQSATENLLAIMKWHQQTERQVFDPFDQRFDSVWSNHFQTPDDNTNIESSSFYEENPFNQSNLLANKFQPVNSIFQDNLILSKVIDYQNEFCTSLGFIITIFKYMGKMIEHISLKSKQLLAHTHDFH